jgi:60 kDa SS-A/Ro ribonucleoprotein
MTNDPLADVSTRSTPQSQPIPGRSDQVANTAGGFVFAVDDWTRLRRFLVLGTSGGTYYISQKDLTRENADVVLKLAESDGLRLVQELVTVSLENLAPKVQPTIFSLAIAASAKDAKTRAAALDALPKICRTGYHLFLFARYVEQFRGWGHGLRNAISRWYNERPLTGDDVTNDEDDEVRLSPLALDVIKYRQREGWSHRDLLRLAHPVTDDPRRNALYRWVLGKDDGLFGLPELIDAADEAGRSTNVKDVVRLIEEHNLPWEALPSEMLREPSVWEALAPRMGYTALIRNVNRMSSIGLLKPLSDFEKVIVGRLKNHEALRRSRVHPFAVLLAMTTYQAGRGVKGSMTWVPNTNVVDALDGAFYGAFENIEPSGRNIMVALDVSGSMGHPPIANSHISPRVGSAAMALITLATEPNTMVTAFASEDGWYGRPNPSNPDDGMRQVTLSPRMRLDDVVRETDKLPFGGTDCSLPMLYAQKHGLEVDTFVVYTDSETWAGGMHPTQALQQYRRSSGRQSRLVVVGMTSNGFTIADPKDAGMLDVVGFDASAPKLISEFAAGTV